MEQYYDFNVYKDSEFMRIIDKFDFKKEHKFSTLKDVMNENGKNWILFNGLVYHDRLPENCDIFIITSKKKSDSAMMKIAAIFQIYLYL